jgi:hypothetical protein
VKLRGPARTRTRGAPPRPARWRASAARNTASGQLRGPAQASATGSPAGATCGAASSDASSKITGRGGWPTRAPPTSAAAQPGGFGLIFPVPVPPRYA